MRRNPFRQLKLQCGQVLPLLDSQHRSGLSYTSMFEYTSYCRIATFIRDKFTRHFHGCPAPMPSPQLLRILISFYLSFSINIIAYFIKNVKFFIAYLFSKIGGVRGDSNSQNFNLSQRCCQITSQTPLIIGGDYGSWNPLRPFLSTAAQETSIEALPEILTSASPH